MNEQQFRKLFPNASAATIKRNLEDRHAGLPPGQPQRPELRPLDLPAPRKTKDRRGPVEHPERYRVVFTIHAVRPCDWDNYSCKELQDLLVHAGCLPGDDWRTLEGAVIVAKVGKPEEEKTVIEITRLT